MSELVLVWLLVLPMLFLLVVPLVLLVWALVDLVRRPEVEWTMAGQDRMVWVLIVVLVGLIGPILYLLVGRTRLNEARLRLAGPPPPPPV
jgi:peptidoglycan/LPS O-acetylase OafA/YrhL